MKNVNNFQIAIVEAQDVAQHSLDFFVSFSLALHIKVLFRKKRRVFKHVEATQHLRELL